MKTPKLERVLDVIAQSKWVVQETREIAHGVSFYIDNGTIITVYNTGKTIMSGKCNNDFLDYCEPRFDFIRSHAVS